VAITAFLDENQGRVDIAADARNAFNSFCRSRIWGPLLQHFPSLAALGRLMHGDAARIVFNEAGVGHRSPQQRRNSLGVLLGELPLLPHHPAALAAAR